MSSSPDPMHPSLDPLSSGEEELENTFLSLPLPYHELTAAEEQPLLLFQEHFDKYVLSTFFQSLGQLRTMGMPSSDYYEALYSFVHSSFYSTMGELMKEDCPISFYGFRFRETPFSPSRFRRLLFSSMDYWVFGLHFEFVRHGTFLDMANRYLNKGKPLDLLDMILFDFFNKHDFFVPFWAHDQKLLDEGVSLFSHEIEEKENLKKENEKI